MYAYVVNNPINFIDSAGLSPFDGLGTATRNVVGAIGKGLKNAVGASILSAGPGINSNFERQLINNYFFGEGQDFVMSQDQTSRYNQNPNSPEFDYGIGRPNPNSNGRIDRYDFDPQPWGRRTIPAEIATRMGRYIGDMFGGVSFDVYPNRSSSCP